MEIDEIQKSITELKRQSQQSSDLPEVAIL